LVNSRREIAAENEDYEKAAKYKQRAAQISEDLKKLEASGKAVKRLTLTSDDVADVVARMTGVPLTKVIRSEARYLLNLVINIGKFVIRQNEAVTAVAKAVRRNRSGVGASGRPIGSFVFLRHTGVGKTDLARVLARDFFGSPDALVKIDMSEF